MAEANNTVNPDDLDSIDALLDEAEFDLDDLPDDKPEQRDDQAVDTPPDDKRSEPNQELDELAEDLALDPELSSGEEQALNDMLDLDTSELNEGEFDSTGGASAALPLPEVGLPKKQQVQDDADDFIARREQVAHKSDELTVEEMDSIKKMLIGFGSGLSILVIIAIVIASLAAFGSNTDPALESELVDIKEELEITRVAAQANEKSLRDINRKLDAVSFQVEQLSADVMSQNQPDSGVLRGAVSGGSQQVEPVVTKISTSAEAKIDSLARNLAVAQRRIVEINNRVTSMQTQQGSVLQAVKSVEKTFLEKQLTVSESPSDDTLPNEVSESRSNIQGKGYRYQAPAQTGLIYQSGHGSVYP